MGGNFLTSDQVRKLEKMPTKKELITAIAVMVKKVRPSATCLSCFCCSNRRTVELFPNAVTAYVNET